MIGHVSNWLDQVFTRYILENDQIPIDTSKLTGLRENIGTQRIIERVFQAKIEQPDVEVAEDNGEKNVEEVDECMDMDE